MNQTLLLVFIAAIMGSTTPVNAQAGYQSYAAQNAPISVISSLDQRYYECMENPDCPTKDRLQIMTDINGEIGKTIRDMGRTCMDMDYKNCIGQQAGERRQWRKMHDQMSEMMTQMDPTYEESASTMNNKEPAVGDTYKKRVEDRKNWWRNMRDGKKEPEAKND